MLVEKQIVCIILLLLHLWLSMAEIPAMAKYYCIIGSGPAGLQMAYYLQRAGRDYIVFEETSGPGSFFKRYPRHRKLMNRNERQAGSSNKEFNLRHDLLSLISDDDSLRLADFSEQYIPEADELTRYLDHYHQKLDIAVQFDTKISDLEYRKDAKTDHCRYTMVDQKKNFYCCRNVFIGTGWHETKTPSSLKGIEYVDTYDTMSVDPNDYRGQTVLIIGRGISGFETAFFLEGVTKKLHMASANQIRIPWEVQYFGTSHNILTDAILQNTEGFFELDVQNIELLKRPNGKIRVVVQDTSKDTNADRHLLMEGYDKIILCLGFQWDDSIFHSSMNVPSFDAHGVPKLAFPDMENDFQSKQYPGLYFIGPLMHVLDYRKSAGGFIHGYRVLERSLHRLLEWRNHGVRWPSATKTVDQLVPSLLKRANEAAGIYHMFAFLCDLAIYDRSTTKFTYLEEFPISLLPKLLQNSGYEFHPTRNSAFILVHQYGIDFSRPGVDRFRGSSTKHVENEKLKDPLHPVVYFYDGTLPTAEDVLIRQHDEALSNPTALHHILQDLTTKYDGPTAHVRFLRRFVERVLNVDLRNFSVDSCENYALTQQLNGDGAMPLSCDFQNWKADTALSYY